MCGIAGFVRLNDKKITNDKEVLSKMLQLQAHRGPDDQGIEVINTSTLTGVSYLSTIGLGFNRLSIQDLSMNGHQPMKSDDEEVIILLNGEIYNASSFREDLEINGVKFRGTSDTEIVLNLYMFYGIEKTLRLLNGMFAIVIVDLRTSNLYLARDRYGIKPLYFVENAHYFSFSSEMKSFLALPGFNFKLNKDDLDEFLLFRNLINRTLFSGVNNLEPGSFLSVKSKSEYEIRKYYDISIELGKKSSLSELINLKSVLNEAVNNQLVSDVALGVQLSGGIDSSLIASIASESINDLKSFSVVMDDSNYSEENYIDYVVSKGGMDSIKIPMNINNFITNLKIATWHFEQPLNHPNTVALFCLSSAAADHVKVILTGEGADEVFAGYSRFAFSNKFLFIRKMLGVIWWQRDIFFKYFSIFLSKKFFFTIAGTFDKIGDLRKIFPKFKLKNALKHRYEILKKFNGYNLTNQRLYEMYTYLPDLFMRQDKMSMAHSIENRVPFLDNDLVEFAFNLDDKDLLKVGRSNIIYKLPLFNIANQKFGDNFVNRTKQGFGIPLENYLNTEEFKLMWKDIYASALARGIFMVSDLEELDLDVINKKSALVWRVLTFELWAQQYLDYGRN